MKVLKIACPFILALFFALNLFAPSPPEYFIIKIVDEETGRGVPLVELSTVNNMLYYTDNNGIVAFYEPGLMNTDVFFNIKSHGYEFPSDGFGYRGKRLFTKQGSHVELKIKRLNIAERLYRITGYGVYRDSVLVNEPIPIKQPLLNGRVFGQDTVISAIYKGKIYWFWGDTTKPDYPLGNFAVSGAISDLPEKGGLHPSIGINLNYFTNKDGFSKQMCPIKAPGMKWLEGLLVLTNKDGEEQLFARYAAVKDVGHINEVGLVVFNDLKQEFEHVLTYPTKGAHHSSHPVLINWNGQSYYYLFPTLRIPADIDAIKDINRFENFTCARSNSQSNGYEIERDESGKPVYRWRKGIAPFNPNIHNTLIRDRLIKQEESWIFLHDIATGKPTKTPRFFNGSVYWNEFRKSWIMITMGAAGEIWFSESDTPTGPWVYARMIVNHDKYNFYNPTQHPFFDEQGGKTIYFEGTYTATFSSAPTQTPAFDYNQVMYRLDLSDPRLILPTPVYEIKTPDGKNRYVAKKELDAEKLHDRISRIAFYAIPPTRILPGMIKLMASADASQFRLVIQESNADSGDNKFAFAALPVEGKIESNEKTKSIDDKTLSSLKDLQASSTLLYEYKLKNGGFAYSTDDNLNIDHDSKKPICRVWKNPLSILPADFSAIPLSAK